MKRMCKNIVLDADFIEICIYKCFEKKWNRSDVHRYLSKFSCKSEKQIKELVTAVCGKHHRDELAPEIKLIAESLASEIREKRLTLPPICYRERYDTSSHKLRVIGVESIKQQILDYVAVNALMELFTHKIGGNQFACIPGRGQKFGMKRIKKWITRYPDKCRYVVKADIKKCYPSINRSILKKLLRKYVKNDSVLYLVEFLIDTYDNGLSIGSYLSTWLCNFYLSFAYHYASQNLVKVRRKKNGEVVTKRLIFKVAFWMDDIVMFTPRKADALRAVKILNNYMISKLDLNIKDDWRVYKMGFVDTMGYKIGNDKTTIRSKTFVKIRRTYAMAERDLRTIGKLTFKQAQRIISFYGKIKETDSKFFRQKYKTDLIVSEAKRRISYESKISNQTASYALAGA